MKKFFLSVLFILFSVSLFCSDQSAVPASSPKLIKQLESKIFDVHYSIFQEDLGEAFLSVTDEGTDHFEVRILVDNPTCAFELFFLMEEKLYDTYDDLDSLMLKSKMQKDPLFFFIRNSFDADSWKLDKQTGEYYLEINYRTYTSYYDSSYDESYNGDVTILTVLDYQDATAPNSFDDNKYIWEAFEEAHPNIKIHRESLFNEPFFQQVERYVAEGKMPDVFYMWPAGRSANIHLNKLAKDLSPYLKKDGLYDNYSPVMLNPSLQLSNYVAEIPFGLVVTHCMYANTKVLSELGLKPATTYEELKAQLPILQNAGKELIIMANYEDWVMQSTLFSMIVGRYGGASWANDILSGKANFTDGPFKKAVQMLQQMYDDGVISQMSLATPYGDAPGQFATEKGAYFIDGDWRVGVFLTDASTGVALISPDEQEADIELISFPSLPGELYPEANSGTLGVGYGMSSSIEEGSKKEEAAWELIKWLSGPEMQQRRLDTGASFPSLIKGISYDNLEPLSAKRAQYYHNQTLVAPVFDSIFSSGVSSIVNAKLQSMGLGKISVDDVCQAVQEAFDAE